ASARSCTGLEVDGENSAGLEGPVMPPESPVDGRTVRIDRWHRRQAKTAAEPSPADARVGRYSCEVHHILRVKRKSGRFLTYGGVRERGSAERPHPDIGSCRGSRTERDYPF